jgi:hypothetical protein|nr:hypothetical protein [uncultured Prevotella sp.]
MPATLTLSNAEVLNLVRSEASAGYQERIPAATRGNIARIFETLDAYSPIMNEFCDLLVNRIGLTVFQTNSYRNSLAPLKRGEQQFGGMVQEIQGGLIKAEHYDPNNTNPFGAPKPDIEVNYYSMNRQDVYPMRYNRDQLRQAFVNDGGLSSMINDILAMPLKSDQWDEYLIMRNLIKGAHDAWTMPTVRVPDLATADDKEAAGKEIAVAMREHYLMMRDFIKTQYNPKHMPVSSDELVILGTPAFFAYFDVEVLAAAFHMDKANFISDRTIVVDDFDIAGAQAVLIDASAYVCADNLVANDTIYNPRTRDWISYLHHWGTYALSDMRNMLLFSSTEANNLGSVTTKTVTGVTLGLTTTVSNNAVLEAGAEIELTPKVTYSDSTTDEAVFYLITDMSATAPTGTSALTPNVISPDTGTYVDDQNVLHVSRNSTYERLNITAYAAANKTKLANLELHKVGYSSK